jgi:hypothetical protein
MKLHYPPKAEDAASVIDRIFDKAVEATRPIKDLAEGLKAVAEQLVNLGQAVAVIAHNQAVHHHIIQQMYGMQMHIHKKLTEHSMDMSMPDIDKPKKVDPKDDAAAAAVEARKKAEHKPN